MLDEVVRMILMFVGFGICTVLWELLGDQTALELTFIGLSIWLVARP